MLGPFRPSLANFQARDETHNSLRFHPISKSFLLYASFDWFPLVRRHPTFYRYIYKRLATFLNMQKLTKVELASRKQQKDSFSPA